MKEFYTCLHENAGIDSKHVVQMWPDRVNFGPVVASRGQVWPTPSQESTLRKSVFLQRWSARSHFSALIVCEVNFLRTHALSISHTMSAKHWNQFTDHFSENEVKSTLRRRVKRQICKAGPGGDTFEQILGSPWKVLVCFARSSITKYHQLSTISRLHRTVDSTLPTKEKPSAFSCRNWEQAGCDKSNP